MNPPDGRAVSTYLITFTCYGQHLHGDERGSVDRLHNQPGAPVIPLDEPRFAAETALMREPPRQLNRRERDAVLNAIRKVCEYRGWLLEACHVRTTHIHAIVTSSANPSKIMNGLKAYSSRALNTLGAQRTRHWVRHGSTRTITTPEQLIAAVRYVTDGQGQRLAVWPA